MHRIIYRSVAVDSPDQVILDIIRAAERNNPGLECSGMLLYGPRGYTQLIEGREDRARSLYDRIAADPRHGVSWSWDGACIGRSIGFGLPMGFMQVDEMLGDPLLKSIAPALMSAGRERAAELAEALSIAAHKKYPRLAHTG